MNELTEDQQRNIEGFAELYFTVKEVVTVVGLDANVFNKARCEEDDFKIPFQRGRLKAEAVIRKSVFDLAKNGSSPAQVMALEIMKKSKINDVNG